MRKIIYLITLLFIVFVGFLIYPFLKSNKSNSSKGNVKQQHILRNINSNHSNNFGKNWQQAQGIPVLCYHQIVSKVQFKKRPTPYAVTVSQFRNQINWLKKEHYKTLTIAQFYDYMTGKKPINEKFVLITFDDGLNDFSKHAQKILEKVNFKAVLFIYPTWVIAKKKRALKPWQIANLSKLGYDIESHTFWHPKLTKMNVKDQTFQFKRSRKFLKKWSKKKEISYLAYPFGLFNETSVGLLKKLSYKAAFTIFPGINLPGQNPYAFMRYMVVKGDSLKRFQQKLEKKSIPIFKSNPNFGAIIPSKGKNVTITIPTNLVTQNLALYYKRKKLKYKYNNENGKLTFFLKLKKGKIHNVNIKYKDGKINYRQTMLFNRLRSK